jgi:hypothetical protein
MNSILRARFLIEILPGKEPAKHIFVGPDIPYGLQWSFAVHKPTFTMIVVI